jgi:hypothetical protein
MAVRIKATVTIGHSTGLAVNAATNSFHFTVSDAVAPAELDSIVTALTNFYTGNTSSLGPTSALLSVNMNGPSVMRLYRMTDAPPRLPVRTVTLPTLVLGTGSFPHEVAMVLSFRSSTPSGTPLSRRRGRIYMGPLSDSAGLLDRSGGDVRPSSAARTILGAAGTALSAYPSTDWATFSTVDGVMSNVLSGFVDNAYDTQRRRGTKATARTSWP